MARVGGDGGNSRDNEGRQGGSGQGQQEAVVEGDKGSMPGWCGVIGCWAMTGWWLGQW